MALACLFRPYFLLSSCFFLLLPLAFSISEKEALLKLKNSFTNAIALDSWVPTSTPCQKGAVWKGLVCSKSGVVVGLRLEGMGLSGNIDIDAMVEITTLRSFSVMNNSFHGEIPEINRVGALKALYLSWNQFSGEIPADYFDKMGSLKKVWLSENSFTGEIPLSLLDLSPLIELRLENNQFTGRIPEFEQPGLASFNVSNNELIGEIPSTLSKFDATSFIGNVGLCGKQLEMDCNDPFSSLTGPVLTGHISNKKIIVAIITLGVLLFLVVLFFAIRYKKKQLHGYGGRRDHEVGDISALERRKHLQGSASRVVRGGTTADSQELEIVNNELGIFGMSDLMKATAEVLGYGPLGSCYRATMNKQVSVVVKRVREMNALGRHMFDAEVRRLGKLRHPNILTPLAYYYRKDEKLFVYEYLSKGSLLYLLHGDDSKSKAELDWSTRLMIVQGIARGLDYLHTELTSLDVPHGNLKSSNVLLDHDNHPYLSEYGFLPLVNSTGAQTFFAFKTPEAIVDGIVCPKSDVYCLGILILEILTGKVPCQYVREDKSEDGTDIVMWGMSAFSEGRQAELLDLELRSSQNSVASMVKLLHIGVLCTQSSLEQRLDIKQAVRMIEKVGIEDGSSTPR